MLTNFIHNAAMAAQESPDCVPLLYAPSGVVYLARGQANEAALPRPTEMAEDVSRIRRRRGCASDEPDRVLAARR